MIEDSGNLTPLKRSNGVPRKVKQHSHEEKVLEKLDENDPYASTEVLVSGIDTSVRTVRRQLCSRAEKRFSYKTPNKSCSARSQLGVS